MYLLDTPIINAAPSNGLLAATVGYWPMDENITSGSRADATGHGWTATDVNSNVSSAAGLLNNAINVDTGSKGLSVSANIDTRAQTTQFAVSYWINNSTGWVASQGQVATLPSGGIQGFLIFTNNNGGIVPINFYSTNDAGAISNVKTTGNVLAQNVWNHVLFGYDGVNKQMYVNGVSAITPTAVSGISRGQHVFAIGNYSQFTTGQPALYDEVAYFNFWPSANQIALIYNNGNGLPFSSYS